MIKTDYLLVFLMLTKCFGLTKCNVISFDLASGSIPKSGNSVELICELTSVSDNAVLHKTINKDYNTKPYWSRCSPTACENFKQGYAVTRSGSLVSITIASVSRPEDEKWWTCISGNAIQFELIVYTVPSSVSLEDPERCDLASSTCVSTCTTVGCTYPEPTFIWYYSKNNDDTTERMFGSYGGTSTMQQDSCPNSEGLYSGKIEIPRYTTSPDITMKTIKLQCMMQFPKLPNGPRSNFSGPVQFAVKVSTVTIYNGQMVLKAGDRLTVTELKQETLRCEPGYGHPLPSLKWYIGETIKSSKATFSFTPSNSIHGQDVFCEASNIPGLKIDSVKVALYVKVKLKYVYVEPASDNNISVIENIPEPVVCATSGGRPSATIKWLELNSGNDIGPSDSMKHIITEGDLNITKATKNVSVSRQHKGWILTCEAWNTDKSEYIQANNSKSFEILYPPEKMGISYSEGGVTGAVINVERGTDISLKCIADSNPPVNSFSWSTPSLNFEGEILTIRNISNNQTVHCNAKNTMKPTAGHTQQGSRSITKEINVLYEATITRFTILRRDNEENEDTFTVNENEFLSIVCNVDSNPNSNIKLKQSHKLLSECQDCRILEYNISSANCSHNSKYTCKAQNKVKTNTRVAERKIQVNVPCSPILAEETTTTLSVLPNRSTVLSVRVIAFPIPTDYSWSKNTTSGWQEMTNSSDIQITHTALRFNLTFRKVRKEDYGEYNLTVGNGIGHPSSFLLLLQAPEEAGPQSDAANNGSVAGIIGGVVGGLLVAGMIIAVSCILRRRNSFDGMKVFLFGSKSTASRRDMDLIRQGTQDGEYSYTLADKPKGQTEMHFIHNSNVPAAATKQDEGPCYENPVLSDDLDVKDKQPKKAKTTKTSGKKQSTQSHDGLVYIDIDFEDKKTNANQKKKQMGAAKPKVTEGVVYDAVQFGVVGESCHEEKNSE